MCGLFSTPTCASHHYYILFINDYTRYTFVWVLPDKKSKTCTSAYHTDVREGGRLEIYTSTITIALSPPYPQAYVLLRSTSKHTHLRTYKYSLQNLPIGTYKYTHRQTSITHAHHCSSCGEKGRVDIRCGSAERTDQGTVRIHTIEWIGGKIDITHLEKE